MLASSRRGEVLWVDPASDLDPSRGRRAAVGPLPRLA